MTGVTVFFIRTLLVLCWFTAAISPGRSSKLHLLTDEILRVSEWENGTIKVNITDASGTEGLTWYGPGNRELYKDGNVVYQNKKYVVESTNDTNEVKLTIKNMFHLQSGNYSICVEEADPSCLNTTVIVIGHPLVSVQNETKRSYIIGSRVNFLCSVRSHPPVNIEWIFYPKRDETNPNGFITKTFSDLKYSYDVSYELNVQMAGTLACIANNSMGLHQINVTINPPDHIRETRAKNNISFICKGKYWCGPRNYTKSKGQNIFDGVSHTSNKNGATLNITNVNYSDTGYYYCVNETSNCIMDMSNATEFYYVYVKDTQNLLLDTRYHVIRTPNKEVVLPCRPSSSDAFIVLMKDGHRLETNVNHTIKYNDPLESKESMVTLGYTIDKLSLEDQGEYVCVANMSKWSSTTTFLLQIQVVPEVELQQLDLVDETKTNFKCVVKSPAPVDIRMYFKKCKGEDNNTCTISDDGLKGSVHKNQFQSEYVVTIVLEDEGRLWCVANNTLNSTNKDYVNVTKTEKSEKKLTGLPSEIVRGEDITLTCSSMGELPKWYFNDTPIDNTTCPGLKISNVGNNSILMFINLTKQQHQGYYDCHVNDLVPYTELIQIEEPENLLFINKYIDPSKELKNLKQGSNISLSCLSKGKPKPQTLWYKDNNLLDYNDGIELKDRNQSLIINPVQSHHDGKYTCVLQNKRGKRVESLEKQLSTEKPDNTVLITITVLGTIMLIVLVSVIVIKSRKERMLKKELYLAGLNNFEEGALGSINPELTVEEQADLLPYDQSWEFPREKLKLGRQLGSGAFGMVVRAEAIGIIGPDETTTVAVKMVKGVTDRTIVKALASELKIMGHLGRHLNIVNFLGAWTKNLAKMELMIIVEFCRYGNLRNYLLLHREDFVNQVDCETKELNINLGKDELSKLQNIKNKTKLSDVPAWKLKQRGLYQDTIPPICTEVLVCWAFQVSCGMNYLASRKVLHGDLAARNILLADNNVIKICDFGLSSRMHKKGYYRKKSECPLPVKWMAPESLCDRVFSTQSDVWSFGILLWELFSLACTPYPEFPADDRMYMRLMDGYRMKQPRFAPDSIYKVMWQCWETQPDVRPSFAKLSEQIGNMIGANIKKHFFDLNIPYEQINKRNAENDLLGLMSAPDFRNKVAPGRGKTNYTKYLRNLKAGGYLVLIDSPKNVMGTEFKFPAEGQVSTLDGDSKECTDKGEKQLIEMKRLSLKTTCSDDHLESERQKDITPKIPGTSASSATAEALVSNLES